MICKIPLQSMWLVIKLYKHIFFHKFTFGKFVPNQSSTCNCLTTYLSKAIIKYHFVEQLWIGIGNDILPL